MLPLQDVDGVQRRLAAMRRAGIWPNGLRYLWTDAFGVVLLLSLWRELRDERLLRECEWVVSEVYRVLGRPRGLRIGEEPDRDGQYFHYLAMWIFALDRLGAIDRRYRERAVALARDIHRAFVIPDTGVIWKMREDLSGPYPGSGLGALDAFHGLVVYTLVDPVALALEVAEMKAIVEASYRDLTITQDLALGMMLWMSHFFPEEPWAATQRARALAMLERMWVDPPGYFCREPGLRATKFAFTNYGVSLGLQAVGAHADRVRRLNAHFDAYRSGDEYDTNAITHVMACTSRFPGLFLRDAEGPASPGQRHQRER
jgi:hypothetical protein